MTSRSPYNAVTVSVNCSRVYLERLAGLTELQRIYRSFRGITALRRACMHPLWGSLPLNCSVLVTWCLFIRAELGSIYLDANADLSEAATETHCISSISRLAASSSGTLPLALLDSAQIYIRWIPHPAIVTMGDNKEYIRVLSYSQYTTITGWGVLLTTTPQIPCRKGPPP